MKRSLPTSAPFLLAATLKKKCCTLPALLLWSLLLSLTGGLVAQDLVWAKQISGTSYERPRSVAVDADGNVYTTGVFYGTVDFDPGPGTFNLVGSVSPVGDLRPDIFVSKLDASGNFVWAKRMGGTGLSGAVGTSIAVDGSNVYITGFFSGTVDFDPGPGTFNLTPVSNTGNPFVINRDIYVCKLDAASGNLVWVKSMGGQDALIDSESIAVDDSGNVYTTGSFDGGTVDFDPGVGTFNLTNMVSRSMFVHKLDASGNFVWVKSMGGDFNQGRSVAVDGSGNVYTTGYFSRTGDFDPGPGTFNLVTNFKLDIFVSKLDASGNFVWAKNMGSPWDDEGIAIAVDDLGNVYTTGIFTNTADFDPGPNTFYLTSNGAVPTQYDDIFISKLDASGNFVWAKKIGDTGRFDFPSAIAVDGSGNVYTTGSFENTVDFDPGPGVFNLTQTGLSNIFISMLDASGNFLAAKRMGGNDFAFSNSLVLDGLGNIYLTGSFRETIDLDPDGCTSTLLTSAGNDDIFVVKMRPPLSPPTTTGASVACGGPVVTGLTATCIDDCTPTWWNAPVGGTQQGADNESPFDPTGWTAEEGAVDLNTPGTYTFYAQCECQGCFSPRTAAVLTVEACCAAPDAICQPTTTIYLDGGGLATLEVSQVDNGSNADCGLASIVLNEEIYNCSDMAQDIPVTLTVTDNNGASDVCTSTLRVIDNIPPSIDCPAGFSVNTDPGQCGALVDLPWPTYSDNCTVVALGYRSIQVDPNNGTFSDWFDIPYLPYNPQATLGVGTWKIEWRVQDQSGLFDYCDMLITVNDNENPVIGTNTSGFVNPASVSIPGNFNDELGCVGDWQPDCPNIELTFDTEDQIWQGTFNIPAGGWEYKAALDDSWSENYGANAQYFGPNIGLNLNSATNVKFYYDPQSHWIIDSVSSQIVTAAGNFQEEVGCGGDWDPSCLRSWLQDIDGDGIYTRAISGIPAGTYESKAALNEQWNFSFPASNLLFTVPDNNSIVTFSFNSNTNNYEIFVAPNETCPAAIDITTEDGLCTGSTPDFLALTAASDNCQVTSLTQNPGIGVPLGVGTHTVTITAEDAVGNPASCQTSVTVFDYTPPTVFCQTATVHLDVNGAVTLTVADINAGISDACGIASQGVSPETFGCGNVGSNTVILYAIDNNGNYASCETIVTVEDNVAPNAICQNKTIQLNTSGNASITAGDINNGSNDACGIASLAVAPNSFDCANIGANTVMLTVTDVNNQVSTCTATVTVEDNIDPVITCPGPEPIISGTDAGQCGAVIAFEVTATDNCTTTTIVCRNAENNKVVQSGDFFPVGTTTVVCTATDGSDNTDVCTFDIIVNDTEAPMLATPCPENITRCGAQTVDWTPPAATDNCGVVQTDNNFTPGQFFEVGSYTETYTFYDAAGLSVSCSFVITINSLPEVTIEQDDLPEWCQGVQVLTAVVANEADLAPPLTYEWSTGEDGTDQITVYANGSYSVVVTDANLCTTTAEILVDEDLTELLSAHTIIIDDEMEMINSTVVTGGVGVEDADEIDIEDFSAIQTFLVAAEANIDETSTVADWTEDDSDLDLPYFMNNSYYNTNHVSVPDGGTMTLSGTNYGHIIVGEGATLYIDNANIYVYKLTLEEGATLVFNQATNMMIRRELRIDKFCNVNVDGPTTVLYVRDDVSIKEGSTVAVNIYTREGIEVNDSGDSEMTYMIGLFIAEELRSGDYVEWGWNTICGEVESEVAQFNAAITQPENIGDSHETKAGELKIFPNPTSGVVNVEVADFTGQKVEYTIYDSFGKEVMRNVIDQLELPVITIDMTPAQFANGMYQVSVKGDEEMQTVRFVLSK